MEAHPQKIVIAQRVQDFLKTHSAHTSSGDVSSNDTVWFGSQGTGNIVGIDSSGECVGVFKNTGIAWYKTIEIRRINNQDILFAWGRTYKNNGGQLGYMFVKNIGNGSKLDGASKNVTFTRTLMV